MGLEKNKQNFIFNASRDWKPMEMFLDVVGDMGVTEKSGNESCSCVQYSIQFDPLLVVLSGSQSIRYKSAVAKFLLMSSNFIL